MTESTDPAAAWLRNSPVVQAKLNQLIAEKLVRDHGWDPAFVADCFPNLSRERRDQSVDDLLSSVWPDGEAPVLD